MSITLSVSDMTCEGCEDIVENATTEVRGVDSASADRHDGTVVVEGDATTQDIIDAIDYAGYEATVVETAPENGSDESENGQSTEVGTESEAEDKGLDADELGTGESETAEETTESADDTETDDADEADDTEDAAEANDGEDEIDADDGDDEDDEE